MKSTAVRTTTKRYLLSLLLLALFNGCAFVDLTESGSNVSQASEADVVGCALVGTVSSQTKDKVVFNRNTGNVKEELIVLARNKAAEIGANAIVTDGQPTNGTQRFQAYLCER
jgi:hypothetical protein